jgi:hypothetical protein
MREVDYIVAQGESASHVRLSCRIRAGREWIDPQLLELSSLERDYEDGYADLRVIQVLIGAGTYAYRLLPNRDELWVDLTATPLHENSTRTRSDRPTVSKRYRAVLMEQDNPGLVGRTPQASSEADLNLTAPKTVQLQLLDEGVHQVRMLTVGRVYRNTTPLNALASLLTETTQLLSVNNQQAIQGVEAAPGFNQTPRAQIVIPHGTPLTKVPTLLQNEEGGIYGTGLGCYLQAGIWHLFPAYDLQRYRTTPKVLTILNVPPNRYRGAERTYRVTTNQVVAVAAGDMSSLDVGLATQLNEGNALRFSDARKLLSFAETKGNRTLLKRAENLFEVAGPVLKTGLTNARWAAERSTANPFKFYSQMAQRNGQYLSVQWLHGDAELLYPGMPVKFMTNADGKLVTLHGTLLGVHEQRLPGNAGSGIQNYPGMVTLKLFLSRNEGL